MQLQSGVFSLDVDLRPLLAAPEVEEGRKGGGDWFRAGQRAVSGVCCLGVLLTGPWSQTQATSQPTSIAHLPLTVFSPSSDTVPTFPLCCMLLLFSSR